MKVSYFKKSILILVSLCALFALSGCQEKPPEESQIIADMPGELTEIFVDDVPIGMGIDSIEITRRQTNEKDDTVYFKYEMSGGPYRVTGSYRFDYVYYDQGGWVLEDYATNSEPEIKIVNNDYLTDLVDSMEEYCYEQISNPKWTVGYDITNAPDYRSDDQSIYFTYEVSRDEPNCNLLGALTYTLTIKHDWGLNFYWYRESDSSNVAKTWELVGTWEDIDDDDKVLTVIIDSYDPTEQTIHIASATALTPGHFGNTNTRYWNDLTIHFDPLVSTSTKLIGSSSGLSVHFESDSAIFTTNDWGAWRPERISQ